MKGGERERERELEQKVGNIRHTHSKTKRKCQQFFFMKNNCSNAVLALAVIKLLLLPYFQVLLATALILVQ